MYEFVDAALVRAAATHTCAWDIPPWPDVTGSTEVQVAQWRGWLQQVWASGEIAVAVEVASPVLARRVREVCEGRCLPVRQVRGAVLSVIRYLLRATSRATPFGVFAGVAPARCGVDCRVRFGDAHQALARVDGEWLAGVITRLESCPQLRHRLAVVVNNLAFVRDGRLVVGCQGRADTSSRPAAVEVSVRYTRAVGAVVQAARSPIRVGDLAGKLAAEFPATPAAGIEGMLAELVTRGILITSLRPPMTTMDPLAHVVEELATVGADAVGQVADLCHQLRDVHDDLSRHNRACPPAGNRALGTAVRENLHAVAAGERPVTVDLRVDGELVLSPAVVREAETAAEVLVRLAPYPAGTPAWRDYHSRFLFRTRNRCVLPALGAQGR